MGNLFLFSFFLISCFHFYVTTLLQLGVYHIYNTSGFRSYLRNLVSILPASHYQFRRNNNNKLLKRPRFKRTKTMGDRSFMVAAPVLWKSLPLSVRQAKEIDDFKRSVKYYLFSKAFC